MKNIVVPAPRKLTTVNTVAWAMSSSGVRSSRSIGSAMSGATTVMVRVVAAVSSVPAATERRTPRASPAPNACAVGIANPEVRPQAKPISRKRKLPVAPTAASAWTPSTRPTTTASTNW